jgi:tetratricopeptide (TPR) repeat protein
MISRHRCALWFVSGVSILLALAYIEPVSAASFRSIATQPPLHKDQLSSVERIAASVSASTLNNRGIELMNQGDYPAAQALFSQALQINPRFAPAYSNRAMIHILMGEESAAVQDYTTSLSLNPRDSDVYFNRGLAYAALENNDAAITDYTRALQINPRNAQAYHARGGVYLSLNHRDMARSDFQNAAAIYLQQGNQDEYHGLQEFLKQF